MSANIGAIPITTGHAPGAHPEHGGNYLTHGTGIKSWLLTLDHKRIGLMYLVSVLAAFALGGTFAVILRTMLWNGGVAEVPESARSAAAAHWQTYNNAFTTHGAVMVFLFIIPAIPAVMGNFVLPLMLGAKDVAFPRRNLLSYYLYVGGALFFVYVLLSGVIHTLTGVQMP